jgi:hypothetical protein
VGRDDGKYEKQYIGMAGRAVEEKASYQVTLRAVGKFLDERPAFRVNLIETPDGFAIRYQADANDPAPTAAGFTWEHLLDQDGSLLKRRQHDDRKRSTGRDREPSLTQPRDGYEDFLRALGYELDRTEAYTITLDEMDDGIVLTYLFVDARTSFLPHKRMVFLTPKEVETVKHDAVHRRVTPDTVPSKQGRTGLLR